MDRDARNVVTSLDAFSCVNPGADRQTYGPDLMPCGHGALDRTSRTIERCQKTIAGRLHLDTAESVYLRTDDPIVAIQKSSPFFVAETLSGRGGIDDVSEEHRLQGSLGNGIRSMSGEELLDVIEMT